MLLLEVILELVALHHTLVHPDTLIPLHRAHRTGDQYLSRLDFLSAATMALYTYSHTGETGND